MKALLQRKSVRIGLGVGIILFNACMVYAWVEFVHQTHTRAIERDFARAVEQWEQAPPGVERVEKFVQALKKIDPGYAPAEVKSALRDYTSALEQSLGALRSGRDTSQYEKAMEEARQRLLASVKKYD
jgi:hypothetical protein